MKIQRRVRLEQFYSRLDEERQVSEECDGTERKEIRIMN